VRTGVAAGAGVPTRVVLGGARGARTPPTSGDAAELGLGAERDPVPDSPQLAEAQVELVVERVRLQDVDRHRPTLVVRMRCGHTQTYVLAPRRRHPASWQVWGQGYSAPESPERRAQVVGVFLALESERSVPAAVTGVEAATNAANIAPNRLMASTKPDPHVGEVRYVAENTSAADAALAPIARIPLRLKA
jgi:hypothetical protein